MAKEKQTLRGSFSQHGGMGWSDSTQVLRQWGHGQDLEGACKISHQILLLKSVGDQHSSGNPSEFKDSVLSEDE